MTITNLSRFEVIDKKTKQSIVIPRGYYLDYASDSESVYSLASNSKDNYKVVLADIEIVRK